MKQNTLKKAWEIRKEAAVKFDCKVSDIHFGLCFEMLDLKTSYELAVEAYNFMIANMKEGQGCSSILAFKKEETRIKKIQEYIEREGLTAVASTFIIREINKELRNKKAQGFKKLAEIQGVKIIACEVVKTTDKAVLLDTYTGLKKWFPKSALSADYRFVKSFFWKTLTSEERSTLAF